MHHIFTFTRMAITKMTLLVDVHAANDSVVVYVLSMLYPSTDYNSRVSVLLYMIYLHTIYMFITFITAKLYHTERLFDVFLLIEVSNKYNRSAAMILGDKSNSDKSRCARNARRKI